MSIDLPPAAVGALMGALIAAPFSLLGAVISRQQKSSELRQAAIDALREESASMIAHFLAHNGGRAFGRPASDPASAAAAQAYRKCRASVALQLDHDPDIDRELREFDRLVSTEPFEFERSEAAAESFARKLRPVLNAERERIRREERRIGAAIAALFVAVPVLLTAVVMVATSSA